MANRPAPHAHSAARNLILRFWLVDLLLWPVSQNPRRVIAVKDDPQAVEKILPHLGAWHDPLAWLSTPGTPGPYLYERRTEVDPTADYENLLTD